MFKNTEKKVYGIQEYIYKGVRFLFRQGCSNKLYLFFSSFTKYGTSQKYNYVKFSKLSHDANFIYFLDSDSPSEDSRGTYFLGDSSLSYLQSMREIIEIAFSENLKEMEVNYIGTSKGATGALLLASEIKTGRVFINAPQVLIGSYLEKANKYALPAMGISKEKLNQVLIDKILNLSNLRKLVSIDLFCGVKDDLHLYEHFPVLIDALESKKINYRLHPLRGAHDDEVLEDFSKNLKLLIENDWSPSKSEIISREVNFFFLNNVLKKIKRSKEIDNEILKKSFKDHFKKHLRLVLESSGLVSVSIKLSYGYSLCIYLKKANGSILAKKNVYQDKCHVFCFNGIEPSLISSVTIFVKSKDFRLSETYPINEFEVLDHRVVEDEYVSYRNNLTKNKNIARKIIKNKALVNLNDISFSPYDIDSADSKHIQRFNIGASFKVNVTHAVLEYKFMPDFFSKISSKKYNVEFLEKSGYPVPAVYQNKAVLEKVYDYNECVIKPIKGTGSKGVFIKKGNVFFDLRDKSVLNSFADFKDKYYSYTSEQVLIEELVCYKDEVARDYKVYAFYGKPKIILEVVRYGDKNVYCEYDEYGQNIISGKYKKNEMFSGNGVPKKVITMSSEISSKLPVPFVRVDFLVAGDNIKLGELSPTPGLYSRMNDKYDKYLGCCYLEARGRLMNDLLGGKIFLY